MVVEGTTSTQSEGPAIRPLSTLRLLPAALATLGMLAAAPAGATEFHFHGLLDVVASERAPAYLDNTLIRGDAPFDAYSVRLFCDARVNPRLEVFSQVVLRDATGPYVDGAYLLFTPMPARDLHVLAGKIPWAIGTYAPRTYSNHNPLIGAPLMYQYHTSLVWYDIAPSADALIGAAGTGQVGVNYEGYAMGRGMALVDDSFWDVGVTLSGSQRPLEYALGMTAGTPGWGSTAMDENSGKTVLGRLGVAPLPGVRLGVSGAYGPYLVGELKSQLPAGHAVTDYHEKLAMADAELLAAHLEVRAEGAHNAWETPALGDLEVTSGYVEAKYALTFGAYLAGRYDVQRFGKIADSGGIKHPWDADVTRVETGVGYRFSRDVIGKVVYQHTRLDLESVPKDQRGHALVAAQISVAF